MGFLRGGLTPAKCSQILLDYIRDVDPPELQDFSSVTVHTAEGAEVKEAVIVKQNPSVPPSRDIVLSCCDCSVVVPGLHPNEQRVRKGSRGYYKGSSADSPTAITFCTNRLSSADSILEVFRHELTHLYDVRRAEQPRQHPIAHP